MSEIDKKSIKKALDKFEKDDYVSSKKLLAREIRQKVNDYIKSQTKLKKDPIKVADGEGGEGGEGGSSGDNE